MVSLRKSLSKRLGSFTSKKTMAPATPTRPPAPPMVEAAFSFPEEPKVDAPEQVATEASDTVVVEVVQQPADAASGTDATSVSVSVAGTAATGAPSHSTLSSPASAPSPGATDPSSGPSTSTDDDHPTDDFPPPPAPPLSQRIRCYRLSLENKDFDIHSKPSPLEYGDYMTPWKLEDLPKCAGPIEYVPPVHLRARIQLEFNPDELSDESKQLLEEDEESQNYDPDNGGEKIFRRECNYAGTGFFSFPEDAPPPKPKVVPKKKPKKKSFFGFGKKSKETEPPPAPEVPKKKERICHADMISRAVCKVDDYCRDYEGGDKKEFSEAEKEEKKKKLVSIYAIGAYEILDDLARDGSKRLRKGKDLTDKALMVRNRPQIDMRPSVSDPPSVSVSDPKLAYIRGVSSLESEDGQPTKTDIMRASADLESLAVCDDSGVGARKSGGTSMLQICQFGSKSFDR